MSDKGPILNIMDGGGTALLLANLNSFVLDYTARSAVGGTDLSFFIIKQLPVLPPSAYPENSLLASGYGRTLLAEVLELSYTAWDLEPFARDCGYDGPPFIWDEERRFWIRAELDAAFFHLYLGTPEEWTRTGTPELLESFPTPRHAVDYIMETFPIVKRKDEKAHGTYRTKEAILDIYDAMAEAIRTGQPYQTRLNPPPGPPADAEGNFIPMAQWNHTNWPKHIHKPKEATVVVVVPAVANTPPEWELLRWRIAPATEYVEVEEPEYAEAALRSGSSGELIEFTIKRSGEVEVTTQVGGVRANAVRVIELSRPALGRIEEFLDQVDVWNLSTLNPDEDVVYRASAQIRELVMIRGGQEKRWAYGAPRWPKSHESLARFEALLKELIPKP